MDQLLRLVRQFCAMPYNVGHRNYILSFVEITSALLLMIEETMMDARDVHDREEYYGEIYGLISRLSTLLRDYENAVLEKDSEDESEE